MGILKGLRIMTWSGMQWIIDKKYRRAILFIVSLLFPVVLQVFGVIYWYIACYISSCLLFWVISTHLSNPDPRSLIVRLACMTAPLLFASIIPGVLNIPVGVVVIWIAKLILQDSNAKQYRNMSSGK